MKKKINIVLFIIGSLFLINAIFGRYIVLPGYFQSLENATAGGETFPADVPIWKIIRYLIWAFSYKLGIFIISIGVLTKANTSKKKVTLFILGGIGYLSLAYAPIPGPYSIAFGIGGGLMTILIVGCLFLSTTKSNSNYNQDFDNYYRIIGYSFLAMATYNLCPLLGIKTFCFYPEKMIKYGLQSQAASFSTHILIELILGWFFIFWDHFLRKHKMK